MKDSKDNKKSSQQDISNTSEPNPKSLFELFAEMPYTDKTGKGFVQSIHNLSAQIESNNLQNDKSEKNNNKVTERKSFLHLRSLKIRPE
jgi:hypothetical protein